VRCITTGQAWLGFPTKQTRVVWLTEERPTTFLPGLQRAGLADSTDLIVLSYWEVAGRPWPAIVDLAVAEAVARDAGVLIIDTLAQFAGLRGDEENNAGAALSALAPVQRAAGTGLAVELTRHERKSGGNPARARGDRAPTAAPPTSSWPIGNPKVSTRRPGASCAPSAGSPRPPRPWSSKSFLPI
jgi:AAA domain